jgi:hypothetical protein
MRSILSRSTFVCLLLSLVGCASYQWVKPGASKQDFSRDQYECQSDAARLYPAAFVAQQISSGYVSPSSTYCSGDGSAYGIGTSVYGSASSTCTTYPGQVIAPVSIPIDVNSSNRDRSAEACMYSRGWSLVKVSKNREPTPQAAPMSCETDANCSFGQSCRSRKGGGTECR